MRTPERVMELYNLGAITGLEVRHDLIMILLEHDVESMVNVIEKEFMEALKEWAFQEDRPGRKVNLSQDPDEQVNAAYIAAKEKLRRYFKHVESNESNTRG